MNSEFNPEHFEGQLLDVAEVKIPCAICVLGAVRQGVNYQGVPPSSVVGQTYGESGEHTIHEAVAQLSGTDVCWYHVDTMAQAVDL